MNNRFHVIEIVFMSFLFLITALFAVRFIDFSITPHEDAAILMRYAEHFAQGHGIVWNIGDKPVDGATDFLFMILVGLLVKVGMSLEFATRFIGFSSHVLTIWVVYLTLRRLYDAHIFPVLVTCFYLIVGPGLYYVAAYFGTPFFALFACITWYAALTIILNGETRFRSFLFAVSALITSLIRPEGVILTGLMLLVIVYLKGLRKSRGVIINFLGIFLFFGGLYFLWRWNYFGYPLPNPFYKKGGGDIYLGSLKTSIVNTTKLCLPLLPAFAIGLYTRKTLRLTIGFSIPIIGFASAFVLISDEMNFGARFQYVLLPLALISWWPLIGGIKEDLRFPGWNELNLQKRVALALAALALSSGVVGYQYMIGRAGYHRDGRYDVAMMLSKYKDRDFVIATTEAGLLPLYSGWKALDTWGLNDQWIAHNGGITEEYLDLFKPNIIVWHECFSPLVSYEGGKGPWFEMVMTLKRYVEKNGYVLAAVFGDSPYNTHYYYVRSDFPESTEIVTRIRATDYYWFGTGNKSTNYALLAIKQEQ